MPILVISKILLVLIVTTWAIRKVLSGAPYMPTGDHHIKTMLERTAPQAGLRVVDIGAGDGRIVIAFAKAGADAVGIEHNPLLAWWARRKIHRAGCDEKASIRCADLWKTDFSSFDVVTLFGITHIMPKLEKKLLRELKPGARVFSVVFKFPTWKPAWTDGYLTEYQQRNSD